jgi:putative DNA primase/helicase
MMSGLQKEGPELLRNPSPEDGTSTDMLPAHILTQAGSVDNEHPGGNSILTAALGYAKRGWYVFPCRPEDKRPLTEHGFKNASLDEGQIREWWTRHPEALIGVDCGRSGLVVIDCDVKNGVDGPGNWLKIAAKAGFDPAEALHSRTQSGGEHFIFGDSSHGAIASSAGKLAPGIDIRANGGYVIVPPGQGAVGSYQALGDWAKSPGVLPSALTDRLLELKKRPEPPTKEFLKPVDPGPNSIYGLAALGRECDEVARSSEGHRNSRLNQAAFSLGQLIAGGELTRQEAERALREAAFQAGLEERETDRTIYSGLEAGMLQPRSRPATIRFQEGDTERLGTIPLPLRVDVDFIAGRMDYAEMGMAEIFARMYIDRIIYDHREKQWYVFNGHYWHKDELGDTWRLIAGPVAAQFYRLAEYYRSKIGEAMDDIARKELSRKATEASRRVSMLNSTRIIEHVLKCAQTVEGIKTLGSEWDANPYLLGVANGVIDLRTGQYRPGLPEDHIRSIAPTAWTGSETPCPRWERFMLEIFGGDAEMVSFMQRLLGYGISGLSLDHKFPILWGSGRNGKGTLLETIEKILGPDLVITPKADAIMDSGPSGNSAQPFVAALRGKRLAWCSESNDGRRIDAGLVKQLTGGDTITTRELYTNPIMFRPTHLLMLMTNNKPHINADDQAIWDRVYLIPFLQRFVENPGAENEHLRDPLLPATLEAEASGILAWLVRGFLDWQQRKSFAPPAKVLVATDDYKSEEDTLGQFIAECCVISPTAEVGGGELYEAYKAWAGAAVMHRNTFGEKMQRRFKHEKRRVGKFYLGITLLK